MKRKALIIYCDDTESDPLDSPEWDFKNMKKFLLSDLGGAWYDNEIIPLQNPTWNEIELKQKLYMSNADYCMTIFSGHGWVNRKDKKHYLEIKNGDIGLKHLMSGAKRETIVIDACSGYGDSIPDLPTTLSDMILESNNPKLHRKIYDDHIQKCGEFSSIIIGASPGQDVRDDEYGGAFINSLIDAANNFNDSNINNNVLDIREIIKKSREILPYNYYSNQKPYLMGQKSNYYFPFAVKQTKNNKVWY